MRIDFQTSVVSLLNAPPFHGFESRTVGTGFVVTADGLIATCAHVVDLSQADEPVYLLFYDPHASGKQREVRSAKIVSEYTRKAEDEDIAFLRLEESLPKGVVPLPLGSSLNAPGETVLSFGFPETKPKDGILGECKVLGRVSEDGIPLLQFSSHQVSKGFSGAPLWDDRRQCVIGMVTSIIGSRLYKIAGTAFPLPFDTDQRQTETGFATPVETLQKVCPELQFSEVCPYRGLDVFTEEHAQIFFGREHYVDSLARKLRQNARFVPVFGPSGSGKSSVVRAGLLPRIQRGEIGDSERWEVVVSRPAEDPFKQLTSDGLKMTSHDIPTQVKEWFAQHQNSTRLVLVLDQFEELLTVCPQALRQEFIQQLARLLSTSMPITVILVMRDDFFTQFVSYTPLREWLDQSEGLINVPQTLTREEVTAIVQRPAEVVGLRFEEGLVDTIVDDALEPTISSVAEEGPVARSTILPLLEFALTQLWEGRKDGRLLRKTYSGFGGVKGGVTRWADRVFYDLDEEQRKEARRIFTALVHIGDERQRLPDSRRRLPLAALCRNEREQDHIHQLVQYLANGKLLVTDFEMQSKQEMVEIIHDALIWEWGLMRQWLREDRTFLVWHQELEKRVQAWVETNVTQPARREREKLLRGSDLAVAMEWLKQRRDDLGQGEREFIRASWNLRQRRVIAGVVAGGVLVMTGGGSALWWVQSQLQPYTDIVSYVADREPVYSVAWSPEAGRLASGGAAEAVQVYGSDGKHRYTYHGHMRAITAVTWSPDGFRVASASHDTTVQVWNDFDQSTVRPYVYRRHTDRVYAVAWSPTRNPGTTIASGGLDTTVHVWNADHGKQLFIYRGHAGPVNAIAWSPDGEFIASGSGQLPSSGKGDNTVHVWRAITGKILWILTGHTSHVLAVAWSPDGKYIASAGWDRKVRVWSVSTGKQLYTYSGHTNATVNSVTWSPDSTRIASAASDGIVQVWTALEGRLICTYREHTKGVNRVAWSPLVGETRIASASDDTTVRIWQLK